MLNKKPLFIMTFMEMQTKSHAQKQKVMKYNLISPDF